MVQKHARLQGPQRNSSNTRAKANNRILRPPKWMAKDYKPVFKMGSTNAGAIQTDEGRNFRTLDNDLANSPMASSTPNGNHYQTSQLNHAQSISPRIHEAGATHRNQSNTSQEIIDAHKQSYNTSFNSQTPIIERKSKLN
jgi:hypothetical protein